MRPSKFYKYLPPSRIDVLQNLRIRFTQVSALNDPFESFPGLLIREREWYLDRFSERVEGEILNLGIRSPAKRKQHRRARKKQFEQFYSCYTEVEWLTGLSEEVRHMSDHLQGCLSLSATSINVLMWSHYAQHHEGYVLGFDAEHEYFGKSVSPVIYSSTRPIHNPLECRHSPEIFYTKSPDWQYEQEYRKFQEFAEPIKLQNGNYLLPYTDRNTSVGRNEAIVLFPLPPESISCVILGWKSSLDLRSGVSDALKAHHLHHVPVLRARPSPDRYEVEVV